MNTVKQYYNLQRFSKKSYNFHTAPRSTINNVISNSTIPVAGSPPAHKINKRQAYFVVRLWRSCPKVVFMFVQRPWR